MRDIFKLLNNRYDDIVLSDRFKKVFSFIIASCRSQYSAARVCNCCSMFHFVLIDVLYQIYLRVIYKNSVTACFGLILLKLNKTII
mmetsp:Transcript_22282/g.37762  ORF Transcript_22282/g.37762 Transcript_22282/m.37762 type:complete len:86 (-) Transcript_22282:796-1053(-)